MEAGGNEIIFHIVESLHNRMLQENVQQRRLLQSLVSLPVWKMLCSKSAGSNQKSLSGLSFYIQVRTLVFMRFLLAYASSDLPVERFQFVSSFPPKIYQSIIRSLHFVGFGLLIPPAGDCRSLVDCHKSVQIAISLSSWTSKGRVTLIWDYSMRMPLECRHTNDLEFMRHLPESTIHTRWHPYNCREMHNGAT